VTQAGLLQTLTAKTINQRQAGVRIAVVLAAGLPDRCREIDPLTVTSYSMIGVKCYAT
jgi:hypothetical protein